MITDPLIDIVNELQDALGMVKLHADLHLPQICVVGSQSSGKTSVLESLVGRDFLPRGSGIVTRCPLVLKMHQIRDGEVEWAEFDHKKGTRFEDFNQVRAEIEKQTEVLAPAKKVVATPISLSIYSPKVLPLTVVDLPGVVQTAISGQQQDIVQQIEKMVVEYVGGVNTIILAIHPANTDLANSAAISIARRVDPNFDRTIGVLTKIDIMDRGTDASAILDNRELPLKRGWVGVINRNQEDTTGGVSLYDARKKEMDFFVRHPVYGRMADRLGTAYLARMMNRTLLSQIQQALPEMFKRVDEYMTKARSQRDALGGDEDMDKAALLNTLLFKFNAAVAGLINGEAAMAGGGNEGAGELIGGARVDAIFHQYYVPYVRGFKAVDQLTDQKLRDTTRNCNGLQPGLFNDDKAFLLLAKEQVKRMDAPAQQCVNYVHAEMERIMTAVAHRHFDRFPKLKERATAVALRLLEEGRRNAATHVRTAMESEQAYINVKHPKMEECLGLPLEPAPVEPVVPAPPAVAAPGNPPQPVPGQYPAPPPPVPAKAPVAQPKPTSGAAPAIRANFDMPSNLLVSGPLSDIERRQFASLRRNVEAYFGIVKESACDHVPKVIVHVMINCTIGSLHPTLTSQLYKPDEVEELMEEAPGIAQRRRSLNEVLAALHKAREILNKVRDVPLAAVTGA